MMAYDDLIAAVSAKHGVPTRILSSLIQAESSGDPAATSSAGAAGLGQFMPATAREYSVDVSDPGSSIDGAARYLSDLYKSTGSWAHAVSAYNMGPSGAARAGYSLASYAGYPSGRNLIMAAGGTIPNSLAAKPQSGLGGPGGPMNTLQMEAPSTPTAPILPL